jgi:histone acetyltransferase SAS3
MATSEEDAEFEEDDELAADVLGENDEFAANNQLHNGMLAQSEEDEQEEGSEEGEEGVTDEDAEGEDDEMAENNGEEESEEDDDEDEDGEGKFNVPGRVDL